MGIRRGPNIVRDGLVFAVDAANPSSFVSGSGVIWKDQTVNQNDGTLTNGPVFDSDGGGSIDFDGSDDYIEYGSITSSHPMSFYNITNMTLEVWVSPKATGDPWQRIIDKSNSGNGTNGFTLFLGDSPNSTKRIGFIVNQSYPIDVYGDNYSHDVWNHIVITKNSSTWKLYVNGILISTNTNTTTFPSTTTNMRIGSWNHTTGREFKGNISTISAYHTTLTSSEVLQNYNALKGRFGL